MVLPVADDDLLSKLVGLGDSDAEIDGLKVFSALLDDDGVFDDVALEEAVILIDAREDFEEDGENELLGDSLDDLDAIEADADTVEEDTFVSLLEADVDDDSLGCKVVRAELLSVEDALVEAEIVTDFAEDNVTEDDRVVDGLCEEVRDRGGELVTDVVAETLTLPKEERDSVLETEVEPVPARTI